MAKKKEETKNTTPKQKVAEVKEEPKVVEGQVVNQVPEQPVKQSNATKWLCCCGIGCVILILFFMLLSFLPFILPVPMMPRIF